MGASDFMGFTGTPNMHLSIVGSHTIYTTTTKKEHTKKKKDKRDMHENDYLGQLYIVEIS